MYLGVGMTTHADHLDLRSIEVLIDQDPQRAGVTSDVEHQPVDGSRAVERAQALRAWARSRHGYHCPTHATPGGMLSYPSTGEPR